MQWLVGDVDFIKQVIISLMKCFECVAQLSSSQQNHLLVFGLKPCFSLPIGSR